MSGCFCTFEDGPLRDKAFGDGNGQDLCVFDGVPRQLFYHAETSRYVALFDSWLGGMLHVYRRVQAPADPTRIHYAFVGSFEQEEITPPFPWMK